MVWNPLEDIPNQDPFGCAITISDLTLGAVYTVLFCAAFYQLVNLCRASTADLSASQINEKYLQKIFLVTLTILTLVRAVNFFVQPFFFPKCERDIIMGSEWWLDMMGSVPAGFYFSAFTILIYKFASIYHTILKVGYRDHKLFFWLLRYLLIFVNVAIYVILIVTYSYQGFVRTYMPSTDSSIGNSIEKMAIYALAAASLILGIAFAVYGSLIFFVFWQISRLEMDDIDTHFVSHDHNDETHENDETSLPYTPRRNPQITDPSHTLSPTYSTASHAEHADAAINSASKPMRKLAVVTFFCNVCFCTRAVILLFYQSTLVSTWYTSFSYFFFSEVIPIALMMFVLTR